MEQTLPRLRDDLVRRRQEGAEGVQYILKDPAKGEFFRLREVEGYIADQLGTGTGVEELRANIEKQFDGELSRESLSQFIKSLDRNGLLENERGADVRARKGRRRLAGSALYFRINLCNPNALLDWLARHFGFFYTRWCTCLMAATIISAAAIALFNWDDIVADAGRMYQLSTVPMLVGTIFIIGTAHEFAHGLTCKRFGGEVHDMGFLMMYLQPALYCNVSDAWLFPEKSKRLLVGFAGPWFELFLGALATLLWRVTAQDALINQFCLIAMASTGAKTLLNFNPLIKLDGYYLLSDWLDIANLRKRSFAYIGDVLRRIGGTIDKLPEVTDKERKVFLLYGLAGMVGSVAIFTYTSLFVGQLLIADRQRVAFGLFSGLVGIRYRQYAKRLFAHSEKTSAKQRLLAMFNSAKGSVLLFVKVGLAGALLLVFFMVPLQRTVSGSITVLPRRNADVRTDIAGIVAEVLVHEGEHVEKGQLIARLSDPGQQAALQSTLAQIKQKGALLDQLVAGPTKHQVDVAMEDVSNWSDQLGFAKSKRERIEQLYKVHVVSRSDFDTAREAETSAYNNLSQAQAKLKVLLDGTPPQQIKAARAELAGLADQRDYLEEQLSHLDVRSPAAGVVTTPTRQLVELVGRVLPKGGLVAKVFDIQVITVIARISERDIGDVRVGQRIGVKLRAYPGRTFFGKVDEIGTTTEGAASLSSSDQPAPTPTASAPAPAATVAIITHINNRQDMLKPGMTGMAKVYCGERPMFDLALEQLSHAVRVEFWSWW